MKKQLAIFTAAMLLTLSACQPAPLSLQPYGDVVTAAQEGDWAYGAGALYDLNGDGVEELILQHTKAETIDADGQLHEAPVCGVSVYTMTKDGPVVLLDHENLYIEVGGNGGYLRVAERDGKLFLVVLTSGEDGAGCESVREQQTVYSISRDAANVIEEAVYQYTIGEYGDPIFRGASISGRECTQADYEAWMAAWETLFVINPFTYDDPELGNPDVHSLEDLAAHLLAK